MRRGGGFGVMLVLLSVVPTAARAGWVSKWVNTAAKSDGTQLSTQTSSMAISDGRVRIEQPDVITLIDYNGGRFTLINPSRQTFWSGSIDDYARSIARERGEALMKMGGITTKNPKVSKAEAKAKDNPIPLPTMNPAKLPPITITKTDVTEKIAGYDTIKYEFRAGGDLFQEVWIAPSLDMSADLDPGRYFTFQRKLSVSMSGKAGEEYNALYANDEYRKLLAQGFILKTVNHHAAGSFTHAATSMSKADPPASEFTAPATYRKVQLPDVFPTPGASK